MKKRILLLLLAFGLLLSACTAAPESTSPATTTRESASGATTAAPTEPMEEKEMDLFGSLFPKDGNIPKKKEIVKIVRELSGDAKRITEITYTWKSGKASMEVLSGNRDLYDAGEAPEDNPLQLVYGESQWYNYVLYLPEGYDPADTEKKWPVIYFFHGIGEIGSDLNELLSYGVLSYLQKGGKLDAIVIAPQCPEGSHWADTDVEEGRLKQFVPEMQEKYNIDADRMYLTGLSMGGRCTWKLALAMPNTFAAIAVVCGRTNTYEFETIQNMPIWMFHGVQDSTVSFDNISKILPVLDEKQHRYYKLTIYPEMSHSIWGTVYEREDVYQWLLEQSLTNNQKQAQK